MHDDIVKFLQILEGRSPRLHLDQLTYSESALEPAVSSQTMNYHYGHLAKGYVDRFNKGQGHAEFNRAGAFLHNILFAQYRSPKNNNQPRGAVLDLINREFKNFAGFKQQFASEAMSIQGSGWVYLSRSGVIKTIVNHQIKNDILLLIDWWEHAWALDYQHDKAGYLDNQWRIINWDVINQRLALKD